MTLPSPSQKILKEVLHSTDPRFLILVRNSCIVFFSRGFIVLECICSDTKLQIGLQSNVVYVDHHKVYLRFYTRKIVVNRIVEIFFCGLKGLWRKLS